MRPLTPRLSDQLRNYLAPNVTIEGTSASGKALSAQLSAKDASFVNGLLQNMNSCSTLACMNGNDPAAASPTPFVMPGTTLGAFPTGLVITSAWAIIGLFFFVWGTFGRYKFREQFRRRRNRRA